MKLTVDSTAKWKRSLLFISLLSPLLLMSQEHEKEKVCVASIRKQMEHSYSFIFDQFPEILDQIKAYSILNISDDQESVELNDGSEWSISLFDRYKLKRWNSNQNIVVTQNMRLYSSNRYKLINQEFGDQIEATLTAGPWLKKAKSIKVKNISLDARTIELTDGTHLEISEEDLATLSKWKNEDCVILGFNSGSDRGYETLLIHAQSNSFIQARRF